MMWRASNLELFTSLHGKEDSAFSPWTGSYHFEVGCSGTKW